MDDRGILLVGTDAASVAFALTMLSRRYVRYPALTATDGGSADHERASQQHLAELRSWAQVVVEYRRGAATYVYDHERLTRIREGGRLPVAVTDEPRVVDALLRESDDWTAVLMWCPDATRPSSPRRPWLRRLRRFSLVLRTDRVAPSTAARMIHTAEQMHTVTDS
ncbi:MAG: hypothetical protein L0H64_18675 [Pseudonocardia sp.]|nr:hypothetical protein [Pseudonocardia sp.]